MQNIQEQIFAIIANTASVDVDSIEPTTTIRDLGVASLDTIEMVFKIEETFDVQLGDRDIDLHTATAATLVTAVERALEKSIKIPLVLPAG